ncbi:nitroreductase NfnB [Salmonella enterica subsp. enterica serovar Choleraesuis]|nr:nitroreductase NfnB [Salmonella enterica subsp. enterica serovar Choleraesuis]
MSDTTLSFEDTVRSRYSSRNFLSTPLTDAQIHEVLLDAQCAPSNCNTQPWHVHIVSGASKDALSEAMLREDEQGRNTPDFSFSYDDFYGDYFTRSQQQAALHYGALGIDREDKEARRAAFVRNYQFFNAPHAAFLFMPSFGDNVRVASDIGMYGQNFLLSLTARGYAGIPQTLLGFHADIVRKTLNVSDQFRLLFGISFGYPDRDARGHNVRMPRIPVEQSVVIHR